MICFLSNFHSGKTASKLLLTPRRFFFCFFGTSSVCNFDRFSQEFQAACLPPFFFELNQFFALVVFSFPISMLKDLCVGHHLGQKKKLKKCLKYHDIFLANYYTEVRVSNIERHFLMAGWARRRLSISLLQRHATLGVSLLKMSKVIQIRLDVLERYLPILS